MHIHTSITFLSLTADRTEFEAVITASICLIKKQQIIVQLHTCNLIWHNDAFWKNPDFASMNSMYLKLCFVAISM